MTDYVYRRVRGDLSPSSIKAGTGLLPTSTSTDPAQYEHIIFDAPLAPDQEAILDQYMTDLGYTRDSVVSK